MTLSTYYVVNTHRTKWAKGYSKTIATNSFTFPTLDEANNFIKTERSKGKEGWLCSLPKEIKGYKV